MRWVLPQLFQLLLHIFLNMLDLLLERLAALYQMRRFKVDFDPFSRFVDLFLEPLQVAPKLVFKFREFDPEIAVAPASSAAPS